MKNLTEYVYQGKNIPIREYIAESKVLHQKVNIAEKLIIDKNYVTHTYNPKTVKELREIIIKRYNEQGPGTKDKPIDFNDINISGMTTFFGDDDATAFRNTKFRYIDVSDWDVSKCTDFRSLFGYCEQLVSVGDLSNWNMSKATRINAMFSHCTKLKQLGDLGKWNIHNIQWSCAMFIECEKLEYIGDISNWDLSTADNVFEMFYGCKNLKDIGDISKWKILKTSDHYNMFTYSGITIKPTFI